MTRFAGPTYFLRHWQPLLVAVVTLLVCSRYGITLQPLFGDRAYMLYMAQTVARGEAVYRTMSFGYPPLGPMISAIGLAAGSSFGEPT